MLAKIFFLEPPIFGELMVPDIQFSIGGKHRKRFEEIVECRGSDPQQCVTGARQLDLFGPVFKYDQQAAVRGRVGQHSQMGAIG